MRAVDWLKRKFSIVIKIGCLILAGICIFAFLWFFPKWQVRIYLSSKAELKTKTLIELENDTRRTWAQILGGVFFLITAYFTWRRVTATEKNVLIAQEGQITERFTKAIEQLGDKQHLEVRLVGIYALERIAKDSPKDHRTIMEILTAYVRANAPWMDKAAEKRKNKKIDEMKSTKSTESSPVVTEKIKPLPDIQAILTVIGRRTLAHEEREVWKLNLSETDLRGLILRQPESHLEGAILIGAHLEGADLMEADIRSVEGLTTEQLSKVNSLFEAKLDPDMMEQIKEKYPHVLEELMISWKS